MTEARLINHDNDIIINISDTKVTLNKEMMPSFKFEKYWNFFKSMANGFDPVIIDNKPKQSVGIFSNGIWNIIPLEAFTDILSKGVNENKSLFKIFNPKRESFKCHIESLNIIGLNRVLEDRLFTTILKQFKIPSMNLSLSQKETLLVLNLLTKLKNDNNCCVNFHRDKMKNFIEECINLILVKREANVAKIKYINSENRDLDKYISGLVHHLSFVNVEMGVAVVYCLETCSLTIYKA